MTIEATIHCGSYSHMYMIFISSLLKNYGFIQQKIILFIICYEFFLTQRIIYDCGI